MGLVTGLVTSKDKKTKKIKTTVVVVVRIVAVYFSNTTNLKKSVCKKFCLDLIRTYDVVCLLNFSSILWIFCSLKSHGKLIVKHYLILIDLVKIK